MPGEAGSRAAREPPVFTQDAPVTALDDIQHASLNALHCQCLRTFVSIACGARIDEATLLEHSDKFALGVPSRLLLDGFELTAHSVNANP